MDVDTDMLALLADLPAGYWLATLTLIALTAEAAMRYRERWAIPVLMVYVTIFGWYIMEPINSPETMAFSSDAISAAFVSVFIFLVAFRFLCSIMAAVLAPRVRRQIDYSQLPAERVFWIAATMWVVLLAIGVWRLEGDLFAALFPIGSREQVTMWQRAAGSAAGTFGFAVSVAAYLYILLLALFGMLLPLLKSRGAQIVCIALILIAWPYAFLQGSRNVTLAVFVPLIFSFLFFSRARFLTKFGVVMGAAVFIEWAMRQIITYRNVGFDYAGDITEQSHQGLNMASELVYCVTFINTGVLEEKWGMGLLAEFSNLIPRFLWPNKPLLGIDYAVARGFSSGSFDIGVFATISRGVIGQGVLDFGPYLGPIVMAAIMALWAGFLARLRAQGTVPRVCLFLVGMGLTFNLGRDITMLVLWPMVFAYIAVVLLERFGTKDKAAPAPALAGFDLENVPAE